MEMLGHWGCALGKDILFQLLPLSLLCCFCEASSLFQHHCLLANLIVYLSSDPKQQRQISMGENLRKQWNKDPAKVVSTKRLSVLRFDSVCLRIPGRYTQHHHLSHHRTEEALDMGRGLPLGTQGLRHARWAQCHWTIPQACNGALLNGVKVSRHAQSWVITIESYGLI